MTIRNTSLDVTPTVIYTSTNQTAVSVIYFCNHSIGPVTFSVHVVPVGQTPDVTNLIYYNVQLSPSDTYIVDSERLLMDDGDTIVAFASQATSVSATVSFIGV